MITFDSTDPLDGATDVDNNKIVSFVLDSDAGPGAIDENSISVQMDPVGAGLVQVIDMGMFQPGWEGAQSQIAPGPGPSQVTVTIEYESLPFLDNEPIAVVVDADDGTPFSDSFSFTTGTAASPGITISTQTPAPGATDVDAGSSIQFDLTSAAGNVDLASLNVTIDGNDAILGGVLQPGYDGPPGGINPPMNSDQHTIEIQPDAALPASSSITVDVTVDDEAMSGPYNFNYSFTTGAGVALDIQATATTPAADATGVAVDTQIEFGLTHTDPTKEINQSTIDVSVDGNPAISGGVFQAGYDGPGSGIAGAPDNLNVTIEPTSDLPAGQLIAVDFTSIDDTEGNGPFDLTADSYSFTTAGGPDVDPPTLEDPDPADQATGVQANPFVWAFTVRDPSGVDQASINARLKRVSDATFESAVVAGVVQPGWTEQSITVLADGFRYVIQRDERLDYETDYAGEIDAGDLAP